MEPIVFLGVQTNCGEAVEELFGDPAAPPEFDGIPAALFEGYYRSQDTTVTSVLPLQASSASWLETRASQPARAAEFYRGPVLH